MTYPPQQSGQGGWGNQSGGWPPQQQQPGWPHPQSGPQQQWPQQQAPSPGGPPQQAGWPPPGGYPPPFGHPPQGQPGFGGPGQPPGFGGPHDGPPKKSKAPWLIGGIGGGFVLLLIVIVTLALTLGGSGDPEKLAAEFAEKLQQSTRDPDSVPVAEFRPLLCDSYYQLMLEEEKKNTSPEQPEAAEKFTAEVKRVDTNGDHGRVYFNVSVPGEKPDTMWVALTKENDEWKICEAK